MTAYQEDLISLDDLRQRMPDLRNRERINQAELQSLVDQLANRTAYLLLAETFSNFLTRPRTVAQTLNVAERQRILRLLVKEILVSDDTIVIRHSIPIPANPPPLDTEQPLPSGNSAAAGQGSYLLRTRGTDATYRQSA